jgi:hypothetical protein
MTETNGTMGSSTQHISFSRQSFRSKTAALGADTKSMKKLFFDMSKTADSRSL